MQNKIKSRVTRGTAMLVALALCALLAAPALAAGSDDTVHIGSVSDLEALAKNCALDSWSVGKTVSLDTDLDLSGSSFALIPTFGGAFEGNGHTISGLSLTAELAPAGLFGWVQSGGTVSNLNVEGTVAPEGDRVRVGGIAGCNGGTIDSCTFTGTVRGLKQVGGIVGENEQGGRVVACAAGGEVSARSLTGGIVGENSGTVLSCENSAGVNTAVPPEADEDTLTRISNAFKNLIENKTLDTDELTVDTGGIAGASSGSVFGCVNKGTVGRTCVGYNVGGVAGRSDGVLNQCQNSGEVRGRKDVGGIAGQAEPDLELNVSEGTIQQLSDALDELQARVDRAGDMADADSDTLHGIMSELSGYLTQASDSANVLRDGMTDYIDKASDEAQRVSDILDEVIHRMDKIDDDIQPARDEMDGLLDKATHVLRQLAVESGLASAASGIMTAGVSSTKSSVSTVSDGLSLLREGADLMRPDLDDDADTVEKAEAVAGQLKGLTKVLTALASLNGMQGAELDAALEYIAAQSGTSITSGQLKSIYSKLVGSGLTQQQLSALVGKVSDGADAIDDSAGKIGKYYTIFKHLVSDEMSEGVDDLFDSLDKVLDATSTLQTALRRMGVSLGALTVDTALMSVTLVQLSGITSQMAKAVDLAQPAIDEAEDLLDYLAAQPSITIPRADSSVRDSSKELLTSFSGATEQISALSDEAYGMSDDMVDQLRSITDEVDVISDLLIDALDMAANSDASNYFRDISGKEASEAAAGQILSCENTGKVEGDSGVGGIAGTQGLEVSDDPEEDFEELSLGGFNGVYESRAVVRAAINSGSVTARKGSAGGIAGVEALGLLDGCYSYGSVESEDGEAVGGIVGLCSAAVNDCWVKCLLVGETYVGGIVGKCADDDALGTSCDVANCRAIVGITGAEQYFGAIAGDSSGEFGGNVFVSDELNGLDYRSVAGEAEPVSYEQLLALDNVPEAFKSFTLSFVDGDGNIIKTTSFNYGASFGESAYPQAAAQEGSYVRWDKTDLSSLTLDTVVTAEYVPYVLTVAGADTRADGRAVFCVDGSFKEGDELTAAAQAVSEDALREAYPKEKTLPENAEQWELTLPSDGAAAHTVRYLPADAEAKNVAVYLLTDDGAQRLETKTVGSYVTFEVGGDSAQLLFCPERQKVALWPLAVFAGAAAVIFVATNKKKKRGSKAGTKQEQDG